MSAGIKRSMIDVKPNFEAARKYCEKLPLWAKTEVSTSVERFAFLMGVVEAVKPRTVVEIGVSAGTLSGAILEQGVSLVEDMLLCGIDFGSHCYFDENRRIGEVVEDCFPDLLPHFDLHTGKTALDADDVIQRPVDFVYIDADHRHPWASIDLLFLLPHLKEGAVVGFHDTNASVLTSHAHAAVYTYNSLDAEKFNDVEYDTLGSGFCVYRADSGFVDSLLKSFLLPWEIRIDEQVLHALGEMVGRLGKNQEEFMRAAHFINESSPFLLELEENRRREYMRRMESSTSWKLTRPIRWLSRLVG
jgi:predicted O-methyltransferase YrrM